MWLVGFLSILIVLSYYLWMTSMSFRYYVTFTFYYMILWITSGFVLIYAMMHPFSIDNIRRDMAWLRLVKLAVLQYARILHMSLYTRGAEYLDSDEPLVVVCNHQSSLDVIAMMEVWPERCAPLAKKELRYVGWFGLAAWLCGCIFIDRFNKANSRENLARTIVDVKRDKLKVWVFPEGTRNHGPEMLPFKKGAFHIAIQAQIPIVPVVVSSYRSFYSKTERRFDSGGKVIIEVLPPIQTEGMQSEDVPALTDSTRDLMLATFDRITEEVEDSTIGD